MHIQLQKCKYTDYKNDIDENENNRQGPLHIREAGPNLFNHFHDDIWDGSEISRQISVKKDINKRIG